MAPTAQWLTGNWIAVGDDCAGPSVVRYGPGGKWSSGLRFGRWSLQDRQITILVTHMAEDTDDPAFAMSPPRRYRLTIARASATRFMATAKNGETTPYLRCP